MRFFGMTSTAATQGYTVFALRSFFEHTALGPTDRFVLLDNDGVLDIGLQVAFPEIDLQRPAKPRSFAENANHFMDEAAKHGADLWLLNNDLIFSPHWAEPLEEANDAISSPLSNNQLPYQAHGFQMQPVMDLAAFDGKEEAFLAICAEHRAKFSGVRSLLSLPFYCVRIPAAIYREVGDFDPGFGRGGGEDRDYALRAWLAGFKVQFALQSYVLHFGGKSTWRGGESEAAQKARETQYIQHFRNKWGEQLLQLVIAQREDVIKSDPKLQALLEAGELPTLIRCLQR